MMQIRYNAMEIASLMTFANITGGFYQGRKDVYFIRCIGTNPQYVNDVKTMDQLLINRQEQKRGRYIRLHQLPKLVEQQQIEKYKQVYESWEGSGKTALELACINKQYKLDKPMTEALITVDELFYKVTEAASASMRKNFLIKLLYWLENMVSPLWTGWDELMSYKLVYSGELKKHEYLFLYLLTRLGIDVLILHPAKELPLDRRLLELSAKLELPDFKEIPVPLPISAVSVQTSSAPAASAPTKPEQAVSSITAEKLRRPERDRESGKSKVSVMVKNAGSDELGFEELALFAASIVMIEVQDQKGKTMGTGSGIMIGRQGYILTNCHVIRGGSNFVVRIEGESGGYQTQKVIKYNPVLDLALLQIDRILKPITVYKGDRELARGQKVVAIGSPLGFFNSVSDGIISGFRVLDGVEMIQFTAPISPGSSGGAVLNMNGEVIGISTSGFDRGQNINLAVGYRDISVFIGGFK